MRVLLGFSAERFHRNIAPLACVDHSARPGDTADAVAQEHKTPVRLGQFRRCKIGARNARDMHHSDTIREKRIVAGAEMLESILPQLEIDPTADVIQRSNGLGLTVHRRMPHAQGLDSR